MCVCVCVFACEWQGSDPITFCLNISDTVERDKEWNRENGLLVIDKFKNLNSRFVFCNSFPFFTVERPNILFSSQMKCIVFKHNL